MQVIEEGLRQLLQSLPPPPAPDSTLDQLVTHTLSLTEPRTSAENRKTQWEYALRNEIFSLAVRGHAMFQPQLTQGNAQ